MFIQTEPMDDSQAMRFLPGQEIYPAGPKRFAAGDDTSGYPLPARLLALDHVTAVTLDADSVVVERDDGAEWVHLKPAILGAIMDHFVAGLPVYDVTPAESAPAPSDDIADVEALTLDENDPVIAELKDLIETRVRPAATQGGGDVILRGYKDGVVYVQFEGQAFKLMGGVENMLRHYVPEVERVADYRDAIPKPGLETPEAKAISDLLESQINPAVAGHGGHISLVDVDGPRAYIRMEGGCQGCGMANVTLKEGVEVEIKKAVPSIQQVLDVTEHADGTNPYYQQG